LKFLADIISRSLLRSFFEIAAVTNPPKINHWGNELITIGSIFNPDIIETS
jgi:hypothetical protein